MDVSSLGHLHLFISHGKSTGTLFVPHFRGSVGLHDPHDNLYPMGG